MKKYDKDIIKYGKSAHDYLSKKYGEVKPEWAILIELIKDNLQMYRDCQKSIDENGLYNAAKGIKNPLIATLKDLQATLVKEVKELGLSPLSASKITSTVENTDEEDFIEALRA